MRAEGIDGRCTALHTRKLGSSCRLLNSTPRNTLRRASTGHSRLGQNFLVDRTIARRTVAAASIGPNDDVLEIGPGRAALTRLLVERASRVVAVELDPDLAAQLPDRTGDPGSLTVVLQDALEFDPATHFDRTYKLVANLPYYVAKPIVRRFLSIRPRPSTVVVMVQREVADSMTAKPGSMGLLSVMVQLYAAAKTLFTVPPKSFRPRPKVSSAVVKLEPYSDLAVPVDNPDSFISFVAAGFRAPRKQIHNSLKLGLQAPVSAVAGALADANIDGSRRPSTLNLHEWADLYWAWLDKSNAEDRIC